MANLTEAQTARICDIARGYDVICQNQINLDDLSKAKVPRELASQLPQERFDEVMDLFKSRGKFMVSDFEDFLKELHNGHRVEALDLERVLVTLERNVVLNVSERTMVTGLYHNFMELQEDKIDHRPDIDQRQFEGLGNGVFQQTVSHNEAQGSMYLAQWELFHLKLKQERGVAELSRAIRKMLVRLPLTHNETLRIEQLFCCIQVDSGAAADPTGVLAPEAVDKIMKAQNKSFPALTGGPSGVDMDMLKEYYLAIKREHGPKLLNLTLEGVMTRVSEAAVAEAEAAPTFPRAHRGDYTCGVQRGCRSACYVM